MDQSNFMPALTKVSPGKPYFAALIFTIMYTAEDIRQLNEKIQYQCGFIDRIRDEVGRVIVGQQYMLDRFADRLVMQRTYPAGRSAGPGKNAYY